MNRGQLEAVLVIFKDDKGLFETRDRDLISHIYHSLGYSGEVNDALNELEGTGLAVGSILIGEYLICKEDHVAIIDLDWVRKEYERRFTKTSPI